MNKRLIKKYPNRRLYDTEKSSYITLEDIKQLVLKNISFQVIDSKTTDDITNITLLQIIMELEQKGAPIFTTTVLEQFIRFYGNQFQHVFIDFIDKSFKQFNFDPANFMKNFSSQQMQFWQNLQKEWQGMFKINS